MLSYILKIMQEFERAHGRRPHTICLNPRHMRQLMHECPDIFSERRPVPLGFRVVVLPEDELPHPKALWLPPRSSETRATQREGRKAHRSRGRQKKSRRIQ